MTKLVDSFTGGAQTAKAANQGSQAQVDYGNQAIDVLEGSKKTARADYQPFADTGNRSLSRLESLVSDPNTKKSFIEDNPFFKALTDKSSATLFSNQAAKGKVGSGGTAEALQNSFLLLGNDLVQQQIENESGLANLGFNAVTNQANAELGTAGGVADIKTGQGNSIAAGKIAGALAVQQGRGDLIKAGTQLGGAALASDQNLKEKIEKVGEEKGFNIYEFNYKGRPERFRGVMAQEVQKTRPDAVTVMKNGFLAVFYDMIGIKMEKVWH